MDSISIFESDFMVRPQTQQRNLNDCLKRWRAQCEECYYENTPHCSAPPHPHYCLTHQILYFRTTVETGHPVVKLSDSVLGVSLIFYLRIDLDKECCDCALRSLEH